MEQELQRIQEEMEEFKKIKEEIKTQLDTANYEGDLSDIGNEIGVVIGNYLSVWKIGYEYDDFINGVKHGISLSDKTHGR
jgi:hypothetical protein